MYKTNIDKTSLEDIALSIRSLSMDAIQKANSGHPGMPLGCAEVASVLYGKVMKHNPKDPYWKDRDRFILSAGHASMLLYSILHLSGYDITMDDIKNFRQVGSNCPGHPEYELERGIECTTGPLGQGVSIAVGMAVAEAMLSSRFNTQNHTIVDHYTYSLVGEGCLEEGVSGEAASFAGTQKLGKLIVFYDKNKISIDGPTDITFGEDIKKRYEAYGWQVLEGSMYDIENMLSLIDEAKACKDKPSLIMLESIIGKFSPREGTSDVHGAALGEENVRATKKRLGLDENTTFYVKPSAYEYFENRQKEFSECEEKWKNEFSQWAKENPSLKKQWDEFFGFSNNIGGNDCNDDDCCNNNGEKKVNNAGGGSANSEKKIDLMFDNLSLSFSPSDKMATRASSGKVLNALAQSMNNLVGGSADLAGPNKTTLKDCEGIFSPANRKGRTIEFGIREFAMSAICAGITLHGGFRTFCATFLVFADYLRPQLRLSALMQLPIIYIFTHDSIYVGEDGPTHQSVEVLSSLRTIPNVNVLRPADSEEVEEAWKIAIKQTHSPTCLILTRQDIQSFHKDDPQWRENIKSGAYIVRTGGNKPTITILATGSEVSMSLDAIEISKRSDIRLISVVDYGKFDKMSAENQSKLIGGAKRIICVEAGIDRDWKQFVASKDNLFCIDRFGLSGPAGEVAKALHFTANDLAKKLV